MSQFLDTYIRRITGEGNGASLLAKLNQGAGTIRTLQGPFATVDGGPFSVDVNTEYHAAGAPSDFIAPGADYTLVLDDGQNPLSEVLPTGFTILDSSHQNYPTEVWGDLGTVISPTVGAYNDAAKTIACQLSLVDSAGAAIAEMQGYQPAGVAAIQTLKHLSGSVPLLAWNAATERPLINFSPGRYFTAETSSGVAENNPGVMVSSFVVESVPGFFTNPQPLDSGVQVVNSSGGGLIRLNGTSAGSFTGIASVIVKKSASALFGNSEVYINGALAASVATYFPTVPASYLLGSTTSGNVNGFNLYGAVLNKFGDLSAAELTAHDAWLDNRGAL